MGAGLKWILQGRLFICGPPDWKALAHRALLTDVIGNIPTGSTEMMITDVDTAAFLQVQAVELLAQATQVQVSRGQGFVSVDKTLWAGGAVEQDGGVFEGSELGQGRILNPAQGAVFLLRSSGWLSSNGINTHDPRTVVLVETKPKHGVLETLPNGEFRYTPNKGFLGKDFVSFIVNIEGKKVRLNVPLWIVKEIEEPKAQYSTPSHARWAAGSTLLAWLQQSSLSALLADTSAPRL